MNRLWNTLLLLAVALSILTLYGMAKLIDRQRDYINRLEEVVDERDCSYPERGYYRMPEPKAQHNT